MTSSWDRAAQQYFDPADPKPYCDICDEPWDIAGDPSDWNGETGCHISCEERQVDEEDDGEEMLRRMEQAADEAAAGLPFGGSE